MPFRLRPGDLSDPQQRVLAGIAAGRLSFTGRGWTLRAPGGSEPVRDRTIATLLGMRLISVRRVAEAGPVRLETSEAGREMLARLARRRSNLRRLERAPEVLA